MSCRSRAAPVRRFQNDQPPPRPRQDDDDDMRSRRRRVSETSQEDGEVHPTAKRARSDENEHPFFASVKAQLGDRAHHHVSSILQRKPEIMQMLTDRCRRAIVMKAKHHMVTNKNAFVAGLRNALDVEGVITSFFSFEGFKVIIFVDDDFRVESVEPVVMDDNFRSQYCEFDFRNCVDVALDLV